MEEPPLPSGCGYCGQEENLQRCEGCDVMMYCGPDHKAANYPQHRNACQTIQEKRAIMDQLKSDLINDPLEGNHFIENVGIFWTTPTTRPYMRARWAVVEELRRVKTVQSVKLQLEHLLEMLRLDGSDKAGAQEYVPGLLLRLNKDQDCYDYLKIWAMSVGDWDITQYHRRKKSNVFESVVPFLGRIFRFDIMAPLTLLKIKILLDLQGLEQMQSNLADRIKIDDDVLAPDPTCVPLSPIIANYPSLMCDEGRRIAIKRLRSQIDTLYWAVDHEDPNFWARLVNPVLRYLKQTPTGIKFTLPKDMWDMWTDYYVAWAETPGALAFIKAKMEYFARADLIVMPPIYSKKTETLPGNKKRKRQEETDQSDARRAPRRS